MQRAMAKALPRAPFALLARALAKFKLHEGRVFRKFTRYMMKVVFFLLNTNINNRRPCWRSFRCDIDIEFEFPHEFSLSLSPPT